LGWRSIILVKPSQVQRGFATLVFGLLVDSDIAVDQQSRTVRVFFLSGSHQRAEICPATNQQL
jgi:hypothetical protein